MQNGRHLVGPWELNRRAARQHNNHIRVRLCNRFHQLVVQWWELHMPAVAAFCFIFIRQPDKQDRRISALSLATASAR